MERDEFYSALAETQNYLEHHGIKGQKWGVRRFQREDGTRTSAGKQRYGIKGTAQKALAGVYGINAKTYKNSNKTLASMNEAKQKEFLAKANATAKANAQKAQARNDAKMATKNAKKQAKAQVQTDIGKIKANRTVGHKLATNILAGPFANRTYESLRASGDSRNSAIAKTLVTGMIGGGLGQIVVSSVVRSNMKSDAIDKKLGR